MSLPSKKAILRASHDNEGNVHCYLFNIFKLTYSYSLTCNAFFETKQKISQTKQTVISLRSLKQTTMHKDISCLSKKLNGNSILDSHTRTDFLIFIISFAGS